MKYNYKDTAQFVIWKSRTIDMKILGFRASDTFTSKYEMDGITYTMYFDCEREVATLRNSKGSLEVLFTCKFEEIYANLEKIGLLKFKTLQ